MISRKAARLVAVGWTLFIIVMLSIPGRDLPDVDAIQIDKIMHFVVFAVLGWLWLLAFGKREKGTVWLVIAGGILFAIFSEIYQGMLPFDRSPDPYDAAADSLGIIFSAIIFVLVNQKQRLESAEK